MDEPQKNVIAPKFSEARVFSSIGDDQFEFVITYWKIFF